MIVAHVITRLLRAGSEENTIGTCLAQADAGNQVVLIHGSEWSPTQAARCSSKMRLIEVKELVHAIDPRKDIQAIRTLRALFRDMRPTVVHTHQSKAGIIGRCAARLSRVPVIVHGVHIVPFASVGRMQKLVYLAAERAVAGCTDAFINVSEGTRQLYLQHAVGRPERHFVAHSGFDIERFQDATWPEDWRALCGVQEAVDKPPIILMLAALEPRKRHIEFIESFERITQKVPDVRLLLAGEGPMRQAIEATIARLGLQTHIRLLGFSSVPEQLISLADMTVLTSTREGLPRVIVQSLAGGKPVVTTQLPGVAELITDGSNGLITPAEDLGCTANAVAELLLDVERLRLMQAGARQTDVSSWGMGAMCNTISGIYQQLVSAAK
jgi:glycosyltransferase involved in cell wall biosynthesis